MKRIITSITIVIIMFLCIGWLSNQEHTYTREVTVHNTQDNTLTVVDNNYNVWSCVVDDTTQYNKGDTLTVVMNDNYTDSNIKDDTIIDIKWQ